MLQGMFNVYNSLACDIYLSQALYFLVGGSICPVWRPVIRASEEHFGHH
jgi:hypothetical protein